MVCIGPPGLNGAPGLPGDSGMSSLYTGKERELLMISFLILGLPGAAGQKGEPGKYKIAT